MSGGVVCYIERTPGGTGIKRLRLVAAGLARQWTAPEGHGVSSIESGASGGGPAAAARAGALWIAETLEAVGLKRLAALCIDAEGSICAWISAAGADPSIVRATIIQSGVDGDGSGAGMGAARLLTMSEGSDPSAPGAVGMGNDTSLQALATLDPVVKTRSLPFSKKAPAQLPRKRRLAVLAVQDAIARVLLDELDAHGIETERVVSLWHAMAGAWDRAEAASISDRLISAESPGGAVILVEPAGRLVWAWTRAGELVAGGTMRLATRARAVEEPSSDALAVADGATARRAAPLSDDDAEPALAIDFTPADAGRLAVDWLSWSAQLGHCPQRVVCLAVPGLGDPEKTGMGPEALFANLARTWPGATIDGAVHEDPVGATLARLAGLGPEIRRIRPAEGDDPREALPYHSRPREALAELTARPGRADRRLYQWIGISLCAAAVLVGVIGWQLQHSAGLAKDELDAAKKARADALAAAAAIANVPNLGPKPLEMLEGSLRKVREQNKSLKPPRPILAEAVRVLDALREVDEAMKSGASGNPDDATKPDPAPAAPAGPAGPKRIIMTELEIGPVAGKASFIVPDSGTGPTLLEKVQSKPGVLRWDGSTGTGVANQARSYTLLAPWPVDDARSSGASTPSAPAPTSAPATPAPAAPKKPAGKTADKKPPEVKPPEKTPEELKGEDKKPEEVPGALAPTPAPSVPQPSPGLTLKKPKA